MFVPDLDGGVGADSVEYLRNVLRTEERAATRGAETKAARLAGALRAASMGILTKSVRVVVVRKARRKGRFGGRATSSAFDGGGTMTNAGMLGA